MTFSRPETYVSFLSFLNVGNFRQGRVSYLAQFAVSLSAIKAVGSDMQRSFFPSNPAAQPQVFTLFYSVSCR